MKGVKDLRKITGRIICLTVIMTAILYCAVLKGGKTVMAETEKKKAYSFDDNIMISIFWPPTQGYINDTQYKYMADAGITWVMGSGDNLGAKDVQMKMLALCDKYGIGMTVGDSRLGSNLLNIKEDKIRAIQDEYKDVPGAYGYYLLDEPLNPNIFINAYKTLKEGDPLAYMHLNFLPYSCYASKERYIDQMNDWAKLCAMTGYPLDYLMYDLYPYGLEKGSMNRTGFLINLDAVRIAGLRNGVRTGNYIQSVTQSVAFRSPNEAETAYEINMSLAFGIKQISYFTWFTPHDRSEPFEDGIISADGKPNPKYEFISRLNKRVHNVGKTLINCDALAVYEGQNTYSAIELIPKDFFVQNADKKQDITVSHLRDRNTGRNYCMVVNNSFEKSKKISLKFDDAIRSLQYVSYEDGKLYDLSMEGQTVNTELAAGRAIIIALPEGIDYGKLTKDPAPKGENIALTSEIFCDSSDGNGWYMASLNDGVKYSGNNSNGWKTGPGAETARIIIDFGTENEFNRIDLYPAGSVFSLGDGFPKNFTVSYSSDMQEWRKIAEAKDLVYAGDFAPVLKFAAVKGRYVEIVISEFSGSFAALSEIEIYFDDGTVALPESAFGNYIGERGTSPVKYKENLALKKKVTVSSFPAGSEYKGWGWYPDFLCDGDMKKGWTSDVKRHMKNDGEAEFAVIDLGDIFALSQIKVFPMGCWPKDFEIRLSADCRTWNVVCSETGSKSPKTSYDLALSGEQARFVMIYSSNMRNSSADGYMLQLGEVEVYGTPAVNMDEANGLIEKYIQAGGKEDSAVCTKVREYMEKENVTQSELDEKLRLMLKEVNLPMPGGEAVTFVPEYAVEYTQSEEPEQKDNPLEPKVTPVPGDMDDYKKNPEGGKWLIPAVVSGAAVIAAAAVLITVNGKKKGKK